MYTLRIAFIYIIAINVLTFAVYGIDKLLSKKKKSRIPNLVLLLLAAVGGGFGAIAAMNYFHHKTRQKTFTFGVPVIILIQLILIWIYLRS